MRILLTGASGYLGEVLASHLITMPQVEHVTGIDILDPPRPLPASIEFVRMDIRSPELASLMSRHDVVVHLAFVVHWRASMPRQERDDINLRGIRNVALAVRDSGIRKLIQLSSISAYDRTRPSGGVAITEDFPIGRGASGFYYGDGKALEEKTLGEVLSGRGMPVTLLRPTFITGPLDRATVPGFKAHAALPLRGEPRWQFIHEDDVASAVELALVSELPGPYNVVPDDEISAHDTYQILGVPRVPRVPQWLAQLVTYARWRWRGDQTHPSWIPEALAGATFTNAKLRAAGWMPRYTSAEALRSAIASPQVNAGPAAMR